MTFAVRRAEQDRSDALQHDREAAPITNHESRNSGVCEEVRQRLDVRVRHPVHDGVHAGVDARALVVAIRLQRSGKIVLALVRRCAAPAAGRRNRRRWQLPQPMLFARPAPRACSCGSRFAVAARRLPGARSARRRPAGRGRTSPSSMPAICGHVAQAFAQQNQLQHEKLGLLAGERGHAGEAARVRPRRDRRRTRAPSRRRARDRPCDCGVRGAGDENEGGAENTTARRMTSIRRAAMRSGITSCSSPGRSRPSARRTRAPSRRASA